MKLRLAVTVRNEFGRSTMAQQGAMTKGIRGTCAWMDGEIKRSMTGPKSGRESWRKGKLRRKQAGGVVTYTRGKRRLHHIASAPGEPPARDTGRLMNSIRWRLASPVVAFVGSFGVNYAAALEFGARHRKLAARPYVGPVAKRAEPVLLRLLARYMAEAAK